MRCAGGGGDGDGAIGEGDGTRDGAWRGADCGAAVRHGKAERVQADDHRRD